MIDSNSEKIKEIGNNRIWCNNKCITGEKYNRIFGTILILICLHSMFIYSLFKCTTHAFFTFIPRLDSI